MLGGAKEDDAGEADEGSANLVSAKEEKELQALLDMFAMGVGDVDVFQERLQAELAALEVSKI